MMKLTKLSLLLLSLWLLLALAACDSQRELEIYGEGQTRDIEFPCGTANVKAYTVSRNYFFIQQKYQLQNPAVINKDSLLITYKGKQISYKLVHNAMEVLDPQSQIRIDEEYSINFYIDMPANGDTVNIQDTGYLYCEGKHIPIGSFKLIVRN